jgi:hypothetical protein
MCKMDTQLIQFIPQMNLKKYHKRNKLLLVFWDLLIQEKLIFYQN